MACRATDDAATAGVPRPRATDARRAPPPFSTFHQYSHCQGPDAVRIGSKSKKKPPPAIIPGHDPRRRHDDGVEAENAP